MDICLFRGLLQLVSDISQVAEMLKMFCALRFREYSYVIQCMVGIFRFHFSASVSCLPFLHLSILKTTSAQARSEVVPASNPIKAGLNQLVPDIKSTMLFYMLCGFHIK